MCHKKKLKIENYKNCLEAIQLDNEIKDLKKKMNIDSLENKP